jgi:hypothetical protein
MHISFTRQLLIAASSTTPSSYPVVTRYKTPISASLFLIGRIKEIFFALAVARPISSIACLSCVDFYHLFSNSFVILHITLLCHFSTNFVL